MSKSWPNCYDAIFSRLHNVSVFMGGWQSCCPGHEDDKSKPSLSIKVDPKTGKLIIKCHGPPACSAKVIVSSIGLSESNLFPDHADRQSQKSFGKFVNAYNYKDENGVLKYQVVRWEPKNFTQRRPNPKYDPAKGRSESNREFLNDMTGIRLLPYRLPQLVRHLRETPSNAVFILEGEKACDKAAEYGLTATCSPQGAGKWHCSDYFSCLRGANVICLPDNDPVGEKTGEEAGLAHMEDVAVSLFGWAASVRLHTLEGLPLKGDFYDWIEARPDKGDKESVRAAIKEIIKAVRPWNPSMAKYRNPAADAALLAISCAAKRMEIVNGGAPANWYEAIGRISFMLAKAGDGTDAEFVAHFQKMAGVMLLAMRGAK